jgi:ABC-type bacteriocin/lantibiotic exporter with double-glycine peptidase domain
LAREGGWEVVDAVPDLRQETRQDCGGAALAMVLTHWGQAVTGDAIIAASPLAPGRGIKAEALREFARRQGLQAFLIQGRQDDLDREIHRHRPVLVGVMKRHIFRNYPHYEVVVGMNQQKRRILMLDPAHGLRVDGQDSFATEWAKAGRLALIIFP